MTSRSANSLHYQRGAIGLFGVLTLLLAVLFTALAVDAGRLWMQRRHLQTVADIASIQAAKQMGCSFTEADVLAAAQQAAESNGYTGQLSDSPNVVELGTVTTVGGVRQFTAGAGQQAVHVYATREVPSSLVAGGLFGGTVTLHAEAVSMANPPVAEFSAGSFLVALNSQDSALLNGLLGGLLGGNLNLGLVSYQGIANADVSLLDLIKAKADVGTVEELLDADVQVGELLGVIATALDQKGVVDADVVLAAQQIANIAVKDASVKLGDIISVVTPDKNAAANLGINVLSLITATAMIADKNHAITLPLGVNVPGILSINALVTVIEPPQLAIGPARATDGTMCTVARTAQIRADAGVDLNVLGLAAVDLRLGAQVAQGTAGLAAITDNDGTADVTIEASPGVAALSLTNNADTGPAKVSLLLGLVSAEIGLNLPIQNADAQELVYNIDRPVADSLPQTQSVSSSLGDSLENALGQPDAITVKLLGLDLGGILGGILNSVVSPLLGAIGKTLLDPLLKLLGIQLGGLDITIESISLGQPKPLVI